MYYTQTILRLSVVVIISAALVFSFAFPAHAASRFESRITALHERICVQIGNIFSRFSGSVSLSDFCKVTPPPPTPPTVDISIDPTSITEGEDAILSWTSTNADSCTASVGWTGSKPISGDELVSPEETTTYTLTCENDGVTASDSATLTVTPALVAPTLTLVKTVVNNNGGTAVAANFQAKINGADVFWNVAETVTAGTHTVSETNLTGYTAGTWGGDCATNGTVTLAAGENKTCTITNDDQPGTLVVKKVVTNNNGGTAEADDFTFQVNDAAAVSFELDGQNDLTVNAGTYTVTEPAVAGYTTTYENCSNVAVANGETETCTITNNDIPPAPTTATISLIKAVVNGNGGAAEADDWTLVADGPTDISGVSGGAAVTNAVVDPGEYALSESGGPSGYVGSAFSCVKNSADPVSGKTLTLAAGDIATCTVTNDDQPGTLVVQKIIVNTGGGTAEADDFSFEINDGGATAFEPDGQNDISMNAGMYTIEEIAVANYTASYENCANVVLVNGETETCTITNTYVPPTPVGKLLITEVLYDLATSTPPQGVESANEWIEIYNGTDSEIDVSEYTLHDSGASVDSIPEGTLLPAGAFLIVTASSTTEGFYDVPEGTIVVVLSSSIATSGLGNSGDSIELRDTLGASVDLVSWGTGESDVPLVEANTGHSIRRASLTTDTNASVDWEEIASPTPGAF